MKRFEVNRLMQRPCRRKRPARRAAGSRRTTRRSGRCPGQALRHLGRQDTSARSLNARTRSRSLMPRRGVGGTDPARSSSSGHPPAPGGPDLVAPSLLESPTVWKVKRDAARPWQAGTCRTVPWLWWLPSSRRTAAHDRPLGVDSVGLIEALEACWRRTRSCHSGLQAFAGDLVPCGRTPIRSVLDSVLGEPAEGRRGSLARGPHHVEPFLSNSSVMRDGRSLASKTRLTQSRSVWPPSCTSRGNPSGRPAWRRVVVRLSLGPGLYALLLEDDEAVVDLIDLCVPYPEGCASRRCPALDMCTPGG